MNFLEAQKLLVSILKAFGFFTYKINSDGSLVEHSKLHVLYSIVVFALNHGFFLYTHIIFYLEVDYLSDNNSATKFVTLLEGYAVEFSSLIIFYSIFVCNSPQIEFIQAIHELEQDVLQLKMTRKNYNRKFHKSSFYFVVGQLMFTSISLIYYAFTVPRENFVPFMTEAVNYMLFTLVLILITSFMDNLVMTMGNLLDEISWNLMHSITQCPFHFHRKEVTTILKLHDRLCETVGTFNKSFGIIVLGIFVFAFAVITFEVYFVFVILFAMHRFKFDYVLSFMPLFLTLSKFGFTCSAVQEKVRLVSSNLHKISLKFPFRSHKSLHKCNASILPPAFHAPNRRSVASAFIKRIKFQREFLLFQQLNRFFLHMLHLEANFTANDFFIINNAIGYNVSI